GSFSPSHGAFGNDLLFLCNYIVSLNDVAGSFFYQRVNNKAAVGGHSMGGGSSFLAAANSSSSISAIFNFAAAETNPSAINAASAISKPALLFSGSLDCIVPPGTQMQMYNNLTSSCKAYVNITGALHCQFADNNGTCALGQVLSGCNSSPITAATVFNKTTALLIPFLDYQLKDSCLSGYEYLDALNNTPGIVSTTNCSISPQCGVLPISLETFTGSLLKSSVQLKWTIDKTDELKYFTLEKSSDGIYFDPFVNVPASASLVYVASDPVPFPVASFYRLRILHKDGSYKISRVVYVKTPAQQIALITIMPNPVKNDLQVKLAAHAPQQVFATIYNVNGQVQLSSLIINLGINNKTFSIAKLPPGLYFISFKNSAGILISSAKFIKE
ncbi:MAG: T9SS type A sorting domain-containing protein, partial [Rhizobacter sp.]|nr:T9SS type A sorting domain-containing protein [Ferruginibacter sp.]